MNGTQIRRDSKHRILRKGESIRANGKYQFKYHVDSKAHFAYSWRLEPTDPQPAGKAACLSLRELEKQIGRDLDSQLDPMGKNMTVNELVERYLKTRTGVRPNTLMNYGFVKNKLEKGGRNPILLPNFSCHSLRHTFVTRLCESDINIKVIQSLAGHSRSDITLDIYTTVHKELVDREFEEFHNKMKHQKQEWENMFEDET